MTSNIIRIISRPTISDEGFLISDHHTPIFITVNDMICGAARDSGNKKSIGVLEEKFHLFMAVDSPMTVIHNSFWEKCGDHLFMVELLKDKVMPVDKVDRGAPFFA